MFFPPGVVLAATPLSSLLDFMFQLQRHLASHTLTSHLPPRKKKKTPIALSIMTMWVSRCSTITSTLKIPRHSSQPFFFETDFSWEDICCQLFIRFTKLIGGNLWGICPKVCVWSMTHSFLFYYSQGDVYASSSFPPQQQWLWRTEAFGWFSGGGINGEKILILRCLNVTSLSCCFPFTKPCHF